MFAISVEDGIGGVLRTIKATKIGLVPLPAEEHQLRLGISSRRTCTRCCAGYRASRGLSSGGGAARNGNSKYYNERKNLLNHLGFFRTETVDGL
jgi:hypothetical protein